MIANILSTSKQKTSDLLWKDLHATKNDVYFAKT
jgi:hypothetical protein